MKNFKNSVQLIGYLGKGPELQKLDSGALLTKFSLATNETYKNSKGASVTDTQWHNLIAWGKAAELICKYAKKGSELMIQGKLKYNNYEDKEGNKKTSTQIVVNEFMLLDKKKATEESETISS